jgi:hypothetical protein
MAAMGRVLIVGTLAIFTPKKFNITYLNSSKIE